MQFKKRCFLRGHIFKLDCIEYFEKLRFLLRSAHRCLLCGLLVIVEHLYLCLDVFNDWFRLCSHKFHALKQPNEKS